MTVHCVSIANPDAYLIASGVQDVMSRTFKTDYRGRLYIHSSGPFSYLGVPDFGQRPLPVIHEFNQHMNRIERMEQHASYIGFPNHGIRVILKDEDNQSASVVREYNLLTRIYRHYRHSPDEPFFVAGAVIGHVDLVDIVHNSDSPWAEENRFHWVFAEPTLFKSPYRGVNGAGTEALWDWQLPQPNQGNGSHESES